jgi:predicted GH43/DUF377 family glycosyl hydrolase
MRGRACAVCAALAVLSGCGQYAVFMLSPQPGGNAEVAFTFEERPGPVLARGNTPDVLAPSVADGQMYYSEWDGRTWHTAHARPEVDGWTRAARLLSPSAAWEGNYIAGNGSALAERGVVLYWYHSGPRERPRIGFARDWQKGTRPVLESGPYMSWDERGVADPYVIRGGEYYYMYFLGQDRAARQRIGVARSRDGIQWEKLRTNPILEVGEPGSFDENGLGEPAVWQARGFYWMLYTGRGAGEVRKLGMARSTEGVHWTKLPYVFAGAQDWDSKVICDPSVLPIDDTSIGVYFGGGNMAKPDEGLNGQIGYGILRMVTK